MHFSIDPKVNVMHCIPTAGDEHRQRWEMEMAKLIETNGDFTIVKTDEFNFEVRQDGVCVGCFRTVARCRDLIAMLNGEDL
jgi:hypothetical protein